MSYYKQIFCTFIEIYKFNCEKNNNVRILQFHLFHETVARTLIFFQGVLLFKRSPHQSQVRILDSEFRYTIQSILSKLRRNLAKNRSKT